MAVDLNQQGAWVSTGNPSTVNDATPLFAPGQVGTFASTQDDIAIPSQSTPLSAGAFPRIWQYVQLDSGSATPAFGQLLVWKDHINFAVTTVNSATKRNSVAGVLCNASATLGNYVWILVGGVGPALTENGQTPAAGDALIGGATTAGRFGVIAQGTASNGSAIPLGVAQLGVFLATKTTAFNSSSALPTDTCAVFLTIPRFSQL
jgi:hypothetical protein